jgi:hypothetical protein
VKSSDEIKKLLEAEREQSQRKAKQEFFRASIKRGNKKLLEELKHRIDHPESIVNHNDYISKFCEILWRFEHRTESITEKERKLLRMIKNFDNAETMSVKKRRELLIIAEKIFAHHSNT